MGLLWIPWVSLKLSGCVDVFPNDNEVINSGNIAHVCVALWGNFWDAFRRTKLIV